ncbi:pentatricopeptide repeat-containing protein At1g08070, chloroplastic-like [Magnolia sinica]|uniref:pentatricopeptide repeat-containing protein At1g08070, chloroplastic-like n=1 Tax=Magnolia sinica TaxID=86752 RepID=UPI0026586F00|nr:pentatricopeptide repeat-containing protein At1g08070, chloroplastic-like [Magnolia sinica]
MISPPLSFFLPILFNSNSLTQIYQIHAQILIHALPLHNHLLSKLIDLRSIDYAQSVFDHMPSPNDYSWNSMIKAYTVNGPFGNSLSLYSQMLQQGVKPSKFTYPFVLKACSAISTIKHAESVHTHVIKFGFKCDIFICNVLVNVYSKYSCIGAARRVWDEMPKRDGVSWNSIISGYVYCGEIELARGLFEAMPLRRSVVCWTALINGYGRDGVIVDMLGLFRQMLVSVDDVRPNSATMVCLVSACSGVSDIEMGRWVSVFIHVNAVPLDVMLSTALIDMYSKCGDVAKARRIFDRIHGKNVVSWNAMITGYVQSRMPEEAIQLFYQMRENSVKPNEITMANMLSACASLGALELGREIHLYLGRNGLELNVILATALVDMYSKCGCINDACLVFVKTTKDDVVLWNAMILGLAVHGSGRDSLSIFAQMERVGTGPNNITFIGVLSACTHSGLVEEGRTQFKKMREKHSLSPTVEHYACMVDLLGRAGHLDEAMALVGSMSVLPDSIIWGTLLSAFRIYHKVELANEVGQVILSSEEPDLGCCVLLSNIYAAAGQWANVARVRRRMKEMGMRKPSGCSWIEVDGVVHRFLVEDTTHKQSRDVYWMLQGLMKQSKFEGYVPDFDFL